MSTAIEGFDDLANALDEFEAEVAEAERKVDGALDNATEETAQLVTRTAARTLDAHGAIRSGRLRSSLSYIEIETAHYLVGTDVEYAPHVEFGTEPHIITPNDADVLVFEQPRNYFGIEDEKVFTQYAQHPGTKAQPFLRPALVTSRNEFYRNIEREIRDLLREAFA